jgi:hypothetical protein
LRLCLPLLLPPLLSFQCLILLLLWAWLLYIPVDLWIQLLLKPVDLMLMML